jgi:hypothetical protein
VKHAWILFHAGLSLLPTLLAREAIRLATLHPEFFFHRFAGWTLLLLAIGACALLPLFVSTAARNARFALGDPGRLGSPVHPMGSITMFGVFGHMPALWLAHHLGEDLYSVSFSFVGPPLIAASTALSWRYVHKTWPPPSPPSADEF